jgi:hypothetical protein
MMLALPVALRAGALRLDTGVYVPVIFSDPTLTIISVPLHLWIQATPRLWLGPLFGLRVVANGGNQTEVPLGFGMGTALDRAVDLRAWFLFPDVSQNGSTRGYGGGVALQLRF